MNRWKIYIDYFLFFSGWSDVSCCHHWHSQPTDLQITWEMWALVHWLACDNFHSLVRNSETASHNKKIRPHAYLLSNHIYNKDFNILIVRTYFFSKVILGHLSLIRIRLDCFQSHWGNLLLDLVSLPTSFVLSLYKQLKTYFPQRCWNMSWVIF